MANVIENEPQKIVWITLINKGYIDFTKNFLMSIKNRHINDFQLVIYCIENFVLCSSLIQLIFLLKL